VGTFYQHIFRENLTLVQITKALALLAILAFVFFFACFLKYCLGKKRTELKGATVFVLMGYILMTVLYLKDLLSVFNVKGIFSLILLFHWLVHYHFWFSLLFFTKIL